MKKKYLNFLLIVTLILLGLFGERQNSRSDVISKTSEEYLSKVDGTKPSELESLLISGIASYGDGNKALAIRYFEKAYELGDVRGAVKLYELYNSEKDEEKIKEWEIKAADMGEASVQNNLGVRLYKQGDFNGAEKWYLKSVEQGELKAQNNLGYLYKINLNDVNKALYWFEKSAKSGDKDSKKKLKELKEK